MTRRTFLALFLMAGRAVPGDALREFRRGVDAYLELHRRLGQRLPPLEISADPQQIRDAIDARAEVLRRARRHAMRGQVFTPAVSTAFRSSIRRAIDVDSCSLDTLLTGMTDGGDTAARAIVNGRFSWRTAVATPPCILGALPVLPRELQYRFVGPDIALVDVTANLIVDVLLAPLDAAQL